MISTTVRECPCCQENLVVSVTTLGKVYEVTLHKPEPGETEPARRTDER